MPFTVCTARNTPATGAALAGAASHSSSSWLQALRCSRLSARNRSAYCDRSMESAEDALHGLEHARRLEWLHHEILRARLDRLDHEGLLTHRAAHQDLRVGVVLHDLPHRVDAAHVRHHDVHRDQVGLELLVPLDRLRAGLGFSHDLEAGLRQDVDRKSTRLNSSHLVISYAVFCLKKKKKNQVDVTF